MLLNKSFGLNIIMYEYIYQYVVVIYETPNERMIWLEHVAMAITN